MQNTLITANNKSNGNILEEEINNSIDIMDKDLENANSIEQFENRSRKQY
jgi:hypothetical protein